VKNINKYIGKYRIYSPLDLRTGKITSNEFDTYLKGKYKSEIYRYDSKRLAIYFPSGKSSSNIVLPQFDNLKISYEQFIDGESEVVYLVKETEIEKLHSILKFQIKGKDIKPSSIKTARRQK